MRALWSDRQNCSHNVSQELKRISRFSDLKVLNKMPFKTRLSSGASGGSLQGGASFKVKKAHFAARKKGPENRKQLSKIAAPSVPPPEALYEVKKKPLKRGYV